MSIAVRPAARAARYAARPAAPAPMMATSTCATLISHPRSWGVVKAAAVALRPQASRRRILTFRADALVFRDDLGPEQQQGRPDLETQEHDDRGRQRSID